MNYKEVLQEKFESTNKSIKDAASIDDLRQVFTESMDYYAHKLIPAFFTTKDGEGQKIKDMYKELREKAYNRVVVESAVDWVDLNIARTAYEDYLSGMCKFIEEACGYCIDEDSYQAESATCTEKMNVAKENDGSFIDSIFGGCNNNKQTGTLLESVGNIEYLIDFMDTIKQESIQCDEMLTKIKSSQPNDSTGLLMESARMMTESMNHYVFNTVQNVFDTYNTIHNVLEAGVQKPTPIKPRRMVF